ncbi:MAG: hypothetical protein Gaeavirus6_11 [Gaeavirus sp.]|uniref:Uncharacterized protein n=1 Tax=Gaeavirus sp. TaxID=2487767 RepID=A0A3G4ZYM9_9VIRU|nr:MAG: hypothetical protein Gaeavirus6_11 [Gaeavirus sp.]
MNNSRDTYNLKRIQKFNKIDQAYDKDSLKDLIIKPEKIIKPNINIESMINTREASSKQELEDCIKKRVNLPYKGIISIKDFNYNQVLKKSEDLIIHKVTEDDKKHADSNLANYTAKIKTHNDELTDKYSMNKETEHKKEFEYQHKYKYRNKLENNTESDLRTDRIEFYKKEQEKIEDHKKKMDDILMNLIDSNIISEDLSTINYDKIDIAQLEKTLKTQFGEKEYSKLLNELK